MHKSNLMLYLVVISIIAGVVLIEVLSEKKKLLNGCQMIQNSSFYCKVEDKKVFKKDHGRTEIWCRDLGTDSIFTINPGYIYSDQNIYSRTDLGDTIIKPANGKRFLIINGEKKDSVVLNCENI